MAWSTTPASLPPDPSQWPVHYSRVIENQLDTAHLPIVHFNTIGRGHRTVIDGPVCTLDGNVLRIWPVSRVDDGKSPVLKAQEMPMPSGPPRLTFLFPNTWQNYLAPDIRIFLAFTPIDEGNTMLYIRFYQRFMRFPLLRELVGWMASHFNRIVANQDRRVVISQSDRSSPPCGWAKTFSLLTDRSCFTASGEKS
jgi:phenylpropionate dioxygenase-like ring-hydroxylating dioxygenase large terminal subunit